MYLQTHMSFEVPLRYTDGVMLHVLMGNLLLSLYKMPGYAAVSVPADLPHCFSLCRLPLSLSHSLAVSHGLA